MPAGSVGAAGGNKAAGAAAGGKQVAGLAAGGGTGNKNSGAAAGGTKIAKASAAASGGKKTSKKEVSITGDDHASACPRCAQTGSTDKLRIRVANGQSAIEFKVACASCTPGCIQCGGCMARSTVKRGQVEFTKHSLAKHQAACNQWKSLQQSLDKDVAASAQGKDCSKKQVADTFPKECPEDLGESPFNKRDARQAFVELLRRVDELAADGLRDEHLW